MDEWAALPLGRIRGLRACATDHGAFAVLALDHRQNLRRELAPTDPGSVRHEAMVEFKGAVVRALGDVASGVLLDPEVGVPAALADGSLPARAGLIVALEATGYEGSPEARRSRLLPGWSVSQARRIGADAAKLLLYYHPAASTAAAQEALLAGVAADCAAADLALFVEPITFSVDPAEPRLTGEARRAVVVETAARLSAIGGDVFKVEFPYDAGSTDEGRWAAACAELAAASARPWVLLSGGVDDATFERQAAIAGEAGASGVVVGRSVWAPAATLAPADRDAWLTGEGRTRLERLVALVDRTAQPWTTVAGATAVAEPPGEDWYRRG